MTEEQAQRRTTNQLWFRAGEVTSWGDDPDHDAWYEEMLTDPGIPHDVRQVVVEKERRKQMKSALSRLHSRVMKEAADRMGFTERIENAGGRVVADTCMVVSPIEDMGFGTTGVNSGKAANYLPGFCNQQVMFYSVDELVRRCL